MATSQIEKLIKLYPDDVRHPLIVENPDWEDKIIPAIQEIGKLADSGAIGIEDFVIYIRLMLEICYTMGYKNKENEK